ncbi:MAG TPA: class I SAM-dependent methyltransferase [Gammaproteobacteria bacterium]|nr:class I SAM-dependent methyltransferase [Gammaproteobacteria bacterium]
MATTFQDHFSTVAAQYAQFRPRYPAALFDYLAKLAPGRTLAWDCGTGTGQAAVALTEHFQRVEATDASAGQIAHAQKHARVDFRVAPAEHSGMAENSVDLITVAQALHWFNLPAFHAEVARVLRPAGILALWSYGRTELTDGEAQKIFDDFYDGIIGPYWPPERRVVDDGYRGITLPFPELGVPAFTMEAEMTLPALAGYVRTWSATQRFRQIRGEDPVPALIESLTDVWPDPERPRIVRWPLALRVARKPGG